MSDLTQDALAAWLLEELASGPRWAESFAAIQDLLAYKQRFCIERTFAWLDKFRALLIRLHCSNILFPATFQLAFVLLNLRRLLTSKV